MAFELGALAAPAPSVVYHATPYPRTHWAMNFPKKGDNNFVARFRVGESRVSVTMNCTDCRGYRTLVAIVDPDMSKVVNRVYTFSERMALQQVLAIVAQAYEGLGLISQVKVAGNNAHVFDESRCEIVLGTPVEPLFLHGHVIGRGDPSHEYVAGVPLKGPAPGEIFNMRDGKETWNAADRETIAQALADQIRRVVSAEALPAGLILEEIK